MTFLAIVSVSVISTCVLEFVGFGCSGGQYTRVCTQIAQLNLLTERDWMSLLNHVKLRFSWREFEHILKQIDRRPQQSLRGWFGCWFRGKCCEKISSEGWREQWPQASS